MRKKNWVWNTEKECAAALLGLGRLSIAQVAEMAGVCERTLYYWKRHRQFRESIERHSDGAFRTILEQHAADPELGWRDMKFELPHQLTALAVKRQVRTASGAKSVPLR